MPKSKFIIPFGKRECFEARAILTGNLPVFSHSTQMSSVLTQYFGLDFIFFGLEIIVVLIDSFGLKESQIFFFISLWISNIVFNQILNIILKESSFLVVNHSSVSAIKVSNRVECTAIFEFEDHFLYI